MPFSLRLIEHHLAAGGALSLGPALRVLFPLDAATVESETGSRAMEAETAWHGVGAVTARAAVEDARLLAFELVRQPPPATGGGRALLEHPVALAGETRWLMRCDRVDFAPGGVALRHRHRGGGIRRLLRGALTVTVGEAPPRLVRPGDPWFESGREPVLAVAADAETSFVRVSILPAAIRGQSSILYVDPADATRSKPRTYMVFVDEPLADLRARR
jgi:quercetin dioxygenase-like cupin family protein